MNAPTWLLIIVLTALFGTGGGYWYGRADGVAAQQARQDHQAVTDLTGIIDSHKTLIDQANSASVAMRQATARREATDRKTTEEFRHALAATADSRAGCVFDDGVVRQLAAARDRAAAAAAGGIRDPLPEPAGGAGP
jgi:hypothetical protein